MNSYEQLLSPSFREGGKELVTNDSYTEVNSDLKNFCVNVPERQAFSDPLDNFWLAVYQNGSAYPFTRKKTIAERAMEKQVAASSIIIPYSN